MILEWLEGFLDDSLGHSCPSWSATTFTMAGRIWVMRQFGKIPESFSSWSRVRPSKA
jgi:hypothetical protein